MFTRVTAFVLAGMLCGDAARAQEAPVAPAPPSSPASPSPSPPASPSPSPIEAEAVPRPSRALCIGLGVAAGALLVTGAVLGGLARSRSNEQEGDPANPPVYDAQLQSRGRDGESMGTAAYVLFGLGGAAAVADLILWI